MTYPAPARVYNGPFRAAVVGLAPAATPTDVFVMPGSATFEVYVRRLRLSGTQTTGGNIDVRVLRRSTADTAGTFAAATVVRFDSLDTGAVRGPTAAPGSYTVNPTLGALVGDLSTEKVFVPAATAWGGFMEYDFRDNPVPLHGVAELIAVNLNGVTLTGGSLDIWVEWLESTTP